MIRKIPFIIQAVVFIVSICMLLWSCGTTKYVDKEVIKVDSSWIERNDSLQQVITEVTAKAESLREEWLTTGILFDTIWRDTGSTRIVNKVTFDNGKVKTIEGRILAVNQDLHEKTAELLDAHSTIDDLSMKLESAEGKLARKQDTVVKEIKRSYIPWWIWLVMIAGILARHYWQKIIKFKFPI